MHTHDHSTFDIGHIFLDSLADTVKMLPFLFLAYLAIEYLERRQSARVEGLLSRGGRFGFVPGALLGIIPQCGFSAMAANFYASRVVSLGTLLAVFIATSDEAIPVILSQPGSYAALPAILLPKLGYALLVGFLADVALRRVIPKSLRGGYGAGEAVDCHEHDEHDNIWLATAKHTANIYLVVLGFTFAFGLLVGWLGQERIEAALSGLGFLQPVVTAAFGLIPNCASSVLITQLYLSDSITLGSALAGLSANGGIGLTVLFRANKNIRQNLFILGLLFALGAVFGIAVQLLGF